MNLDKKKADDVLNHAIAIGPNLNVSPKEFYDRIEEEIRNRKLPGLSLSRVEYSEGGLLSDKRLYLRIIRERFAFDTCAAPFGTEFFFSHRSVYSPARVKLSDILIVAAFFAFIYLPLIAYLGFVYATISVLVIALAIARVFDTVVRSELSDVDTLLLKIPGFGPIYEVHFRKETYYRHDTRLLYLEIIPRIVQEIIDDITAKNGVKLNQFERAPVLGELYKRRKAAEDHGTHPRAALTSI